MSPEPSLQTLQDAAQSLKLYRRAELADEVSGEALIDDLYVDPLPNDQVIRTILKANTTFLIGRKGTGKSTLFQRLQSELRKTQHQTSAYIDIKTIFESSHVDPQTLQSLQARAGALPPQALESLLINKTFLRSVVEEIKSELQKRLQSSKLAQIKETFTGSMNELFQDLDAVLAQADENRFISALAISDTAKSGTTSASSEVAAGGTIGLPSAVAPVNALASIASKQTWSQQDQSASSDILLRVFDIKGLIASLKLVLQRAGIRNLFVLIDDFSELPQSAMQVVVDVLLAPLNNWSDEFVKFKVAAYPGRIYLGSIDKTKIDEIHLDMYRLYGSGELAAMEESAIDFTRRLVESRLKFYCGKGFQGLIDKNAEEVWRELYFATMANPRLLGYLLFYIAEAASSSDGAIGVRSIQNAAQRYYSEKIAAYFEFGRFLHESFNERASIYSLKELLEGLVGRARGLRKHDSSEIIRKLHGRPYTSHFHVPVEYEPLFGTLELNFFVTKYFEMADRSGRKVGIYAMNYGLCQKQSIRFGRPTGEREFRLYFVERIFDYTPLLMAYLSKNQEIACKECGTKFAYDQLDALRLYGMRCPQCTNGTVQIVNLSRKYEEELRAVNDKLLLPKTELGILQTLHLEKRPLRANFIAGELDCSYQLVGKRGKLLADRGLVSREKNTDGQRIYEIDPTAEAAYFSQPENGELDIVDELPS